MKSVLVVLSMLLGSQGFAQNIPAEELGTEFVFEVTRAIPTQGQKAVHFVNGDAQSQASAFHTYCTIHFAEAAEVPESIPVGTRLYPIENGRVEYRTVLREIPYANRNGTPNTYTHREYHYFNEWNVVGYEGIERITCTAGSGLSFKNWFRFDGSPNLGIYLNNIRYQFGGFVSLFKHCAN
jgi:hypothetical protein